MTESFVMALEGIATCSQKRPMAGLQRSDHEDGAATTNASHSDSSDAEHGQRPVKMAKSNPPRKADKGRKNSYWTRKNEMERLTRQMNEMSEQLNLLQKQHSSNGEEDAVKAAESTRVVAEENSLLCMTVQAQQWALWGAHATLSDWMNAQFVNPLTGFIHLGSDPEERRKMMLDIKPRRIEDGYQFMVARIAQLDPLKPHHSENRSVNSDGDFCCTRFEVYQFYGARSLKQVFDALTESMLALEISISEALGGVTVREDFDTIENGVCNHRLLAVDPRGMRLEKNSASFAQFEASKFHNGCGDPGYGVVISDFVDVDDLHPYRPHENIRRDVTGVTLLTPHRRPVKRKTPDDSDQTELVVTMSRVIFAKVHKPLFEVDDLLMRSVHEYSLHWGEIIIKSTLDQLTAKGVKCR